MKHYRQEITWFFAGTSSAWLCYLLLIILKPSHPYEIVWTALFLSSFLIFPLFMLMAIPYYVGYFSLLVLKAPNIKKRTIIYGTLSLLLLPGLTILHMHANNYLTVAKVFPAGIETQYALTISSLEDDMYSEIEVTSRTYTPPYTSSISAGSMGGSSSSIELWIDYKIPNLPVNCGNSNGCEFTYIEEYDIRTGQLIKQYNSITFYHEKWLSGFTGEYQHDGQVYTVRHETNEYGQPTLHIEPGLTLKIDQSQPNFITGTITGGNETDIGKTISLEKQDDSLISIMIDNEGTWQLTR